MNRIQWDVSARAPVAQWCGHMSEGIRELASPVRLTECASLMARDRGGK